MISAYDDWLYRSAEKYYGEEDNKERRHYFDSWEEWNDYENEKALLEEERMEEEKHDDKLEESKNPCGHACSNPDNCQHTGCRHNNNIK